MESSGFNRLTDTADLLEHPGREATNGWLVSAYQRAQAGRAAA